MSSAISHAPRGCAPQPRTWVAGMEGARAAVTDAQSRALDAEADWLGEDRCARILCIDLDPPTSQPVSFTFDPLSL
eukprot:scaffold34497_cov56-Isochrysis_galbana.AAC.1